MECSIYLPFFRWGRSLQPHFLSECVAPENIHTPLTEGFVVWIPPFILALKNFDFWDPPPPQNFRGSSLGDIQIFSGTTQCFEWTFTTSFPWTKDPMSLIPFSFIGGRGHWRVSWLQVQAIIIIVCTCSQLTLQFFNPFYSLLSGTV